MHQKTTLLGSLKITSFAFFPIVIYWCFREYIADRGLWIFFDHIEVLYYTSGIELAQGYTPSNVDNPGTPAQLLSWLLISFWGVNPLRYIDFIPSAHLALLILSFLSSLILIHCSSKYAEWRIQIASVWCFFSFSVGLTYLRVFGPEPFYYIFGVLAVCALMYVSFNYDRKPKSSFLFLGCTIGALLTVKFTVLAWLPGLYLIAVLSSRKILSYQTIKNIFWATAGLISTFIVITYKVRDSYPYMFNWIFRNVTRNGSYGSGHQSLPDFGDAIANWQTFIVSNKVFVAIFIALFVYLVVTIKRRGFKNHKGEILILIFIATSVLFTMLFIIRSYQHRYMLPIGICSIALILLLSRFNPHKVFYRLIFSIFFVVMIKSMHADYQSHLMRISQSDHFLTSLDQIIMRDAAKNKIKNPLIVYGWRVPHPALSLRQHDVKGTYLEAVDVLYPNAGHYTPWIEGNTFRLPKNKSHWE